MRALSGFLRSVVASGGHALRVCLLLLGALGVDVSLEFDQRRSHARSATIAAAAEATVAAVGIKRPRGDERAGCVGLPPMAAARPLAADVVGWIHRDARWVVLLI